MGTYLSEVLNTPIPQSEGLPSQVPNSGGGYSFPVTRQTRLERFLVLGSEGGSYYAGQQKLTKENAAVIEELVASEDGIETVDTIVRLSQERRAPKVSPALFALAIAASSPRKEVRLYALRYLPGVARTASHLFEFIGYMDSMRGWGQAPMKAVETWYNGKQVADLVYQVVKYRSRYDWTHRDVLRSAHPKTDSQALNQLFAWLTHDTLPSTELPELSLVHAYEQAKTASVNDLIGLILKHKLTWEMVPSEALKEREVWEALAGRMPPAALVRNLATMTRVGAVAPNSSRWMVDRLADIGTPKARLHPIAVLAALMTYKAGHGARGHNTWEPVSQVTDALEAAFERSFDHAPQTGKRYYVAVDVSGSMTWNDIAGIPGLKPRMGAAALALAVKKHEPECYLAAFAAGDNAIYQPPGFLDRVRGHGVGRRVGTQRVDGLMPLQTTASDSFRAILDEVSRTRAGATDCALPMLHAMQARIPVDCFIILTDNETNAGRVHPAVALQEYRKFMDIPAKLVVVGMVSNGFSIADPSDGGMMDVVGFDPAVPRLIADFMGGDATAQPAPDMDDAEGG